MDLRAIGPSDWRLFRELRLAALTDAPDAFGSTLEDWTGENDTEARWRARLADVPLNLVAEIDGEPSGMVGGTFAGETESLELISLWVAPFARGRGVADALVSEVLAWAVERGAPAVVLAVRRDNAHAIAVYDRLGFVPADAAPASEACRGALLMEWRLDAPLVVSEGV